MSAAEAAEAAGDEEEIDYDALSFTDPRYWAHFYDEEYLDFYEARPSRRVRLGAACAACAREAAGRRQRRRASHHGGCCRAGFAC